MCFWGDQGRELKRNEDSSLCSALNLFVTTLSPAPEHAALQQCGAKSTLQKSRAELGTPLFILPHYYYHSYPSWVQFLQESHAEIAFSPPCWFSPPALAACTDSPSQRGCHTPKGNKSLWSSEIRVGLSSVGHSQHLHGQVVLGHILNLSPDLRKEEDT